MKRSSDRFSLEELSEIAFLYVLTLRILLSENTTKEWAQGYCEKTASGPLETWRKDGTDLYCAIHGILTCEPTESELKFHSGLQLLASDIQKWLDYSSKNAVNSKLTKKFLTRLDTSFNISNSSMRTIRRLVIDWEVLELKEKKLVVTSLLKLLRNIAGDGEILPVLSRLAKAHGLEIENDDGANQSRKTSSGFLADLAVVTKESASSGATASSSIATVVGGLGAGFDNDFNKSVYGPKIIRRSSYPLLNPKK